MTILPDRKKDDQAGRGNFIAVHMQQYPFIFSDERRYRIRRHVAFWVFWWLSQGFLYSFLQVHGIRSYFQRLPVSITESLVFMINHMFLGYALMYFVIPKFILKQRYWRAIGWTTILFLLTALISTFIGLVVLPPLRVELFGIPRESPGDTVSTRVFLSLLAGLRGGITIGGIAAAIKLMKHWYIKEQRNLQLQKENVESQLQLLKAQIHPHFLFNTLNNIYSYTQKSAPEAARMISGLSDLLRFMLYECNQPTVALSKELTMLQDYIELEKIRYGNKLEVHTSLPDDTANLQIAPLLLLPFVENCFKHGTSHVLEHPWINLEVRVQQRELTMKLMNGKVAGASTSNPYHGIGINNVKRRLELLYPWKHDLTITDDEDVFIVNLRVQLELKRDFAAGLIVKQPVHA